MRTMYEISRTAIGRASRCSPSFSASGSKKAEKSMSLD
jgi:hypothetical protein